MRIQLKNWFAGYDALGQEIPASTPAQYLTALRDIRDILLKESDWTQAPDVPLSADDQQDWRKFRQYLRDLPSQYTEETITEVVELPTAPASAPRTWIILDPDHIAKRVAEAEAIQKAQAEAQARQQMPEADHTH